MKMVWGIQLVQYVVKTYYKLGFKLTDKIQKWLQEHFKDRYTPLKQGYPLSFVEKSYGAIQVETPI